MASGELYQEQSGCCEWVEMRAVVELVVCSSSDHYKPPPVVSMACTLSARWLANKHEQERWRFGTFLKVIHYSLVSVHDQLFLQ